MLGYEPVKEFQFCNTALWSKALSTCILKYSWNTKKLQEFCSTSGKMAAWKVELVEFK